MNTAQVYKWTDLSSDNPIPLLERRRVIGEKVMISNVVLKTGCCVTTHAHENEQFAVVLSGRVRFGLDAEGSSERSEVTLGAGEILFLPANVPHSALALEDTNILDVFSPPCAQTGIDHQGRNKE